MLLCARVKDYNGNPLLWRCGAKATTKIGSGKPDLLLHKFSNIKKVVVQQGTPK